ncbi:MAG TPA: hypothetical protein VFQ27_04215 [Xanthobacteraceae bacterium]|nr:hypothetical protein [Xanthobacteraceae bacterium]
MMASIPRFPIVTALHIGLFCLAGSAAAGAEELPRLHTNEAYVEEVTRRSPLNLEDPMAVFAFVFDSLPGRVKVYPTENYYYFRFHNGGVLYGGNLRLENGLRDEGRVHFAYGPEGPDASDAGDGHHKLLGPADGVTVEKVARLVYRIGFRGKSVVFELNDLSGVKPPDGMLGPDERYIGPVFDESAVRFFLVYNSRLKLFQYVLDETGAPADILKQVPFSARVLIGQRTGFAFYQDRRRDRKILIGVLGANARANNYFDGPFDQLPDNFIEGESLRSAILEVAPELKGKIDRFGSTFDGKSRYAIGPYLQYEDPFELEIFERCARSKRVPERLYEACFAIDEEAGGKAPRTLADRLRRRR